MRPLNDRIIAKLRGPATMSKGGIALPDNAQALDEKNELDVIAVGPGKMREDGTRAPMPVKPGDWIYTNKYRGVPFHYQGVEYRSLREEDIFAVVDR